MGGLFSRPKEPRPLPTPDPLPAPPTSAGEPLEKRTKGVGSRRGRTIGLAGALTPQNILKKRLLG